MRGAWAHFARDPSQDPLPVWTRVTSQTGDADVMGFGTDGRGAYGMIRDAEGEAKCEFWAEQGFRTKYP
jgi:hypothetical protein